MKKAAPKKPVAKKAAAKPAAKKVAAKRAPVKRDLDDTPLTPLQLRFVAEYIVTLNATGAYKKAGFTPKNDNVAGVEAYRLLRKPKVAAEIQKAMYKRAEKVGISAEKVLQEFWNIATVDRNELIQHRVGCCRHCYGFDHDYQRTDAEWARDQKLAEKDGEDFKTMGGTGFDPRKPPVEDCPECFGDGIGRIVMADTRNLSPEAKSVFAGLKHGKHGIEMAFHSKDNALLMVGRHLKLFTDVLEVKDTTSISGRMKAARERAREKK
ncbi:terminase small subunit [Herminiimonas contaminans]|uniref:Terminase small subunit n=1 Tax=Herminiimonas contaminans TaxID=1111140 RepID=A0ABS0ESJ1_9BURK|nr:terminase small subunit [Herminiimonas contaminans]MBF8177820.1 terminase small subunit [Herminiimonas contaminans]